MALERKRTTRPRLTRIDRLFWVWLYRLWPGCLDVVVIGSIRRECLDHVIVVNARHLRRILSSYCDYTHRSRTHLSLAKACSEPRPACPPGAAKIVAFPQLGGLHHRYERLAA